MQDLRMRVIEFLNFKQLDYWEMSTGDNLLAPVYLWKDWKKQICGFDFFQF